MTLDEKIHRRYSAVYRTRGIKPIGLVVDRETYIKLQQMSPWGTNFIPAKFSYGVNGDRYKDLLVSVAETYEETIIVY